MAFSFEALIAGLNPPGSLVRPVRAKIVDLLRSG
jgi:hypothetical protein